MANGQEKKKSLGDYFGMKSKDADDAKRLLQEIRRRDFEAAARQDSLDQAERKNAWEIERILLQKMREDAFDMEKRHYFEREAAALKDPRYESGPFKRPGPFTEASPDTLGNRQSREMSEKDYILMQLLGRTQESDPNRNMFRAGTAETLPFLEHLREMDQPTRRLLQMIIDDEKKVNRKVPRDLMVPGLE
tara:strand:+ start:3837 stop:4409 length:573 start_codon:yes stop_codon:yes gene_type:complete